jgi:lipoprotein-releasing system permease protein
LQPNTYQVVVGYGIAQKFSLGLLDFNRQLEVLCQNRKRAIENPEEALIKPILFRGYLLVKT